MTSKVVRVDSKNRARLNYYKACNSEKYKTINDIIEEWLNEKNIQLPKK